MKRRLFITILLVVAAANLALFVWIQQQRDRAAHAGSLTALDPESIRSIRIRRADATLVFERGPEGWRMTTPLQGPARTDRVTDLKALAVLVPLARYPREGQPLGQYGLAPPQLTVWLDGTRLDFGKRNAANGRRFVLTEDGLYLIADTIWSRLNAPASAWIAPSEARAD